MKRKEINVITGEEKIIDLTADEITALENAQATAQATAQAKVNAETKETTDATSGKTKLKNLGLTDDEIKALTGK